MAIVEVPRSSPSVLLELALNRSARRDCDDPDTTAASLAAVVAAAPSVSIEPSTQSVIMADQQTRQAGRAVRSSLPNKVICNFTYGTYY